MSASSSSDAVARIGWDNTDAKKGAAEFVNTAETVQKRTAEAFQQVRKQIQKAMDFNLGKKMLSAQAIGNDEAAAALKKRMELIQQMRRYEADYGVGRKQAYSMAKDVQGLQEKAAGVAQERAAAAAAQAALAAQRNRESQAAAEAAKEEERKKQRLAMDAASAQKQQAREAAAALKEEARERMVLATLQRQQMSDASAAAARELAMLREKKEQMQRAADFRLDKSMLTAQAGGNAQEVASLKKRVELIGMMRQYQRDYNMTSRESYKAAQEMYVLQQRASASRWGGSGLSRGGGGRYAIGNASMQLQDVLVQAQMGTKMTTILTQQGTQLLSAFGPMGAVAGLVGGVGVALYGAKQAGEEAFRALVTENNNFEASLRRISAGGSITDMVEQIEKMGARAKQLREASTAVGYFDPLTRFFSTTTYDANGVGTNQQDAERAVQAELAKKNEEGRARLLKEILELSAKETEILRLRADGQNAEADDMERTLKLAKRLAEIRDMPAEMQGPLRADAYAKNAVEVSAARKKQFEEAFSETEKLAAQQQQLEDMKRKAALEEMTAAQKIAALQVDLNRAVENEKILRADFVPDASKILAAEQRRVQAQITLNGAMREYNRERQAAVESAKREAEHAAHLNDQRKQAVMSAMDEYNLLKAKGTQRKSDDDAVERGIAIRRRREQLMKENGMSFKEADAKATEMRNMEEKAANGGRSPRIRGVQSRRLMGSAGGGGLDAFASGQGKAWGANALPESDFSKLQRTPFQWEKDLIPSAQRPPVNPLEDQAAQNAGKRSAGGEDWMPLADRLITELPIKLALALLGN